MQCSHRVCLFEVVHSCARQFMSVDVRTAVHVACYLAARDRALHTDSKDDLNIKRIQRSLLMIGWATKQIADVLKGFGRVFSRTVATGQQVSTQGPHNEPDSKEYLNIKNIQHTVVMMGWTTE